MTRGYGRIFPHNHRSVSAAFKHIYGLSDEGVCGGTLVAVDGVLFHGNASKDSIFTRRKLSKQIAKLDQEIEAYGRSLDTNDAAEAKQRADGSGDGNQGSRGDVEHKGKELMARRERAEADLKCRRPTLTPGF